MKELFTGVFKILGLMIIFIVVVLVIEWVYSEISFQRWLSQDERRLDFSVYDSPEGVREAILARLPLGSSEEAVHAFRMTHGFIYRKPTHSSYGPFGVGMIVSRAGRGLFGLKRFILTYESWGIHFALDPDDHTLIDVDVISQGGL